MEMERRTVFRFYATGWYIDSDTVPMHLTPSSSNAILSSRASILESQETRQLLWVSDKHHGTVSINSIKNLIIISIQLKISTRIDNMATDKRKLWTIERNLLILLEIYLLIIFLYYDMIYRFLLSWLLQYMQHSRTTTQTINKFISWHTFQSTLWHTLQRFASVSYNLRCRRLTDRVNPIHPIRFV